MPKNKKDINKLLDEQTQHRLDHHRRSDDEQFGYPISEPTKKFLAKCGAVIILVGSFTLFAILFTELFHFGWVGYIFALLCTVFFTCD